MQYYKAIQVRTAKEALNNNIPSLASIKRQMITYNPAEGELKTIAFITLILTDLVMSFNVGKTMNQPQVVQAVEYIQRDYYFLKPSELKYCFDNAKMGRYGIMYDRIDMAIIFDWIEKYLEERMFIIEDERTRSHEEIKKVGSEQNNLLLNVLTDTRFSISKEVKTETEPIAPLITETALKQPKAERQKTEAEIIVQDIFREFDKLHRDLDNSITDSQPIRMVDYNGQWLTQDKFLQTRLEELNKI